MNELTVGKWQKLKLLWHVPFINKIHTLTTAYYRIKGATLYRFVFKEFGKGSYIRKPLLLFNTQFVSIGERVGIGEGVRLEVVHHNAHRVPSLSIGDGSSLEQRVHIVCHSSVQIGKNVTISANCCILDVTHPYEDISESGSLVNKVRDDDSFVEIGDGSLIGYGVVILPNVRIGKRVVIGSNSVVNRSIPDYSVAVGSPAKIIKRYEFAIGRWVRVNADDNLAKNDHSTAAVGS